MEEKGGPCFRTSFAAFMTEDSPISSFAVTLAPMPTRYLGRNIHVRTCPPTAAASIHLSRRWKGHVLAHLWTRSDDKKLSLLIHARHEGGLHGYMWSVGIICALLPRSGPRPRHHRGGTTPKQIGGDVSACEFHGTSKPGTGAPPQPTPRHRDTNSQGSSLTGVRRSVKEEKTQTNLDTLCL